jgi:hypothetical protein
MFFVNILQIILFLFLVLEKGASIFFPHISLFGINFFLLNLFLFFLIYLSSKIISHLCFLFLSYSLTSFLFLLFLSELVFNMSHHFLIFSSDLFFLILDNRIGKRGHYCFNLLFTLSFFFFSFFLEFILESSILLLSFDILDKYECTSILYLSASCLSLCWFY